MTSVPWACGALEATRTSTSSPQPPTTGKEETTDSGLATAASGDVELSGSKWAPVICTVGTVTKRYCTLPCQPPFEALPEESKLAVRVSGSSMRRTSRGRCRARRGLTLGLPCRGSFHATPTCRGNLLLQRTG